MTFEAEFLTVDAVLGATGSPTYGVDAFALSLIKTERQTRKIFTYLVFQSPAFGDTHMQTLRAELAGRKLYYEHFIHGIGVLSTETVSSLVGARYDRLLARLMEAKTYRNKIFHGQVTATGRSRGELLDLARDCRSWCKDLAIGSQRAFGYDGFARNSFQKSASPNIATRLRRVFASTSEYGAMLDELPSMVRAAAAPPAA